MSILTYNTNLMALNANRNLSNHYGKLSDSVRRLSSGLRVSTAADDAAGLAIRELMRADITALNQGVRNINDAISAIQTADGALGVIDEKLIRMKELSEQAATGTYNSDQRIMIDSEFQAMANEIQRIATSTDFNGIKLIDGSLSGEHDGSGMQSTGSMKIHFGTANDSAEDYYYLNAGDATLKGLGLTESKGPGSVADELGYFDSILGTYVASGERKQYFSGIINLGIIPKGTKDFTFDIDDMTQNDTIQLFTVSGKHVAGTVLGGTGWILDSSGAGKTVTNGAEVVNEENGFSEDAVYDGSQLNGTGADVPFTPGDAGNSFTYNGMTIGYSGDGNPTSTGLADESYEYLSIDEVTEDLVLLVVGEGVFYVDDRTWTYMPPPEPGAASSGDTISIETQELAQKALDRIDEAIIRKDKIRANLGAMQNRLENTASNLQIQAENLQAAESRISDVDVAQEMTSFVSNQILTQAATAMLSQANSMPNMLTQLIG